MRQAVVYEDASRQWKYLCLVLQASERRREDQAVIVSLKRSPVVFPLLLILQSVSFAA